MKLGARWLLGETPHRGVPPTLYETIELIETEFPDAHSWTLTWLENRPVLNLDAVATVSLQQDATIRVRRADTNVIRAENAPSPGITLQKHEGDLQISGDDSDDDDDDWLN